MALRSAYDEALFRRCLGLLKAAEIEPHLFATLRPANTLSSIPPDLIKELLNHLSMLGTGASTALVIELLSVLPFDDSSPFDPSFVAHCVIAVLPAEGHWDAGLGYVWKVVCEKLVKWDVSQAIPLLTTLLSSMEEAYQLSYDSYVEPFATELVRLDPPAAWGAIKGQLAQALPQWRSDLLQWLKGGHGSFDQSVPQGANTFLQVADVISWIREDPARRAPLMAHAAPRTLDDDGGGQLTRALLSNFGEIDGVSNGISAVFFSGSWTGPESLHLKERRDRFRRWLGAGFDQSVVAWLELEIQNLDRQIEREEISEERD